MSELLLHRRENIQQAFFCLLDSMMHCMEHDSLVCILKKKKQLSDLVVEC